jgi:hypothetical protein
MLHVHPSHTRGPLSRLMLHASFSAGKLHHPTHQAGHTPEPTSVWPLPLHCTWPSQAKSITGVSTLETAHLPHAADRPVTSANLLRGNDRMPPRETQRQERTHDKKCNNKRETEETSVLASHAALSSDCRLPKTCNLCHRSTKRIALLPIPQNATAGLGNPSPAGWVRLPVGTAD